MEALFLTNLAPVSPSSPSKGRRVKLEQAVRTCDLHAVLSKLDGKKDRNKDQFR